MTDICKTLLDNYDERMKIMDNARLVGDNGESVYQARLRIAQCGKSAIEGLQKELFDKPSGQNSIKKSRKLRKYVNLMRRLCSKKKSCKKKFKSKKGKPPSELVKNIQKICAKTGIGNRKGFCGDVVTLEDAIESTKISLRELQGILAPRKGISSGQDYEVDPFKYLRPLSVEQKVSDTTLRKLKIYTLDDIAKELINLANCENDDYVITFDDSDYMKTPNIEFTVLNVTNTNTWKPIMEPLKGISRNLGFNVAKPTCKDYFDKKFEVLKKLDNIPNNQNDEQLKQKYQELLEKEGVDIYKMSDLDLEFEKNLLEQKISQLQKKNGNNNIRSTGQKLANFSINTLTKGWRKVRGPRDNNTNINRSASKYIKRKTEIQNELAILKKKLELLTNSI